MRKITFILVLSLVSLVGRAQTILIQENFQNWTAQAAAGNYSITKKLYDGTTDGTFSSNSLIVAPATTAASPGSAGRIALNTSTGYIQFPELGSIGQILINAKAGSGTSGFKLQVFDGVSSWSDISGTTTAMNTTVTTYTFNLNYSSAKTIRIYSLQSGTTYYYDIQISSYLPALSTPANIITTATSTTGFTASWDAVSNASGYIIKTYIGGTNLISTTNVPTGISATVSGLLSGLDYTYKVISIGNGTSYSDSPASSAVSASTNGKVNTINTDFNDNTWGTIAETLIPYKTTSINGYNLDSALVYSGSKIDIKGSISHTNRIALKGTVGKITLPTINSMEQLEIHAMFGSTGTKSFLLEEYNSASNTWTTAATLTMNSADFTTSSDMIFTVNVSRATPSKFRISNSLQGGGLYIYQIIARTTAPVLLDAPTAGVASNIKTTTFTANWTPVSNATGYLVKVYKNSTVKVTQTVSGQSTAFVAITGLQADSTYTYKIQALGNNNVDYSDSYLSTPSAAFTTAHQVTVSGTASVLLSGITENDDVLIGSGSNLNLDQTISVNKITIAAGGKLTLADTKAITANTIILQSDNTGAASFVDENAAGANITATVQQYITSGRNWYMTTPIASATGSNLLTNAGSVVCYNEATEAWDPVVSGTALNPMRGYISAATATTGAVSFTGTLNTGAKSINLTRTNTATKPGFNLVGNPYPSFVSWEAATKTNLETTMWYRSRNAGNTAYIFDTYNATTHAGTGNNGTAVTTYIPPMQAFWVRVASGFSTGSLAFDNTMRSHGSGTERMKAPKATEQQLLRLQVSNGTNSDEAIVVFNANASNNLDAYDSYKMSNNNIEVPEIYTLAANEELVINGMNSNNLQSEIPLGFRTGTLRTFSIKATEATNFKSDTRIILKDNVLNKQTDLTDGSQYTFSSDVANTTGRFSLIIKSAGVTTDVEKTNSNLTNLVFVNNNGQIVVQNTISLLRSMSIYNSIGQLIEKNAAPNSIAISSKLNTGVYFIHLQNENNINTVCKVKVD